LITKQFNQFITVHILTCSILLGQRCEIKNTRC